YRDHIEPQAPDLWFAARLSGFLIAGRVELQSAGAWVGVKKESRITFGMRGQVIQLRIADLRLIIVVSQLAFEVNSRQAFSTGIGNFDFYEKTFAHGADFVNAENYVRRRVIFIDGH